MNALLLATQAFLWGLYLIPILALVDRPTRSNA